MLHRIHSKRAIIFTLVTCLLAACVTPTKENNNTVAVNQDAAALELINQGNFTAAAEEFLKLAETDKKLAEHYHLRAAQAFYLGNDLDRARTEFNAVKSESLADTDKLLVEILAAEFALTENDALLALNKLESVKVPADTPADIMKAYLLSLATAQQLDHQKLNAFHTRIRLAQYLGKEDESDKNKKEIWSLLTDLDTDSITNDLDKNGNNPSINGWLELALLVKHNIYDKTALTAALDDWNSRYSGHPAQGTITDSILADADKLNQLPRRVALLLPFDSNLRDIALAIRDGFVAAWYESGKQITELAIYNSSPEKIVETYNQAINDGAGFIVGPLEKDVVQALVNSVKPQIPVLLLNQIDDSNNNIQAVTRLPAGVYQFGLLPEDDAINVADHARTEGLYNALVMTPANSWGDRIDKAFESRLQQQGGKVVEHVTIPPDIEDYAGPVKNLLNINDSEQRNKQLIATISRSIHFEPRHRTDADFIFIAATPQVARQIVPQLRFYRADDIATFALSSVYSGVENSNLDGDLDGVVFADMPWILSSNFKYSPVQQTLNRTWDQEKSPYRRFYAFGLDAFRLIPQLGKLQSTQSAYDGATGILTVNPQGQVKRTQSWARFVDGVPEPLSTDKSVSYQAR